MKTLRHTKANDGQKVEEILCDAIARYENFKLDGKPVKHYAIGLHEETVIERAAIHDMLVELGQEASKYTATVRDIDIQW